MSTAPYLSVVVTTRHDDDVDGGSDLLERLQRFVSCFDEQCRQTGLDAEVIVVDWNRPPQRERLAGFLRLPDPCFCTYRFIDVPPDVHNRLRHADVLPAFPMIAKNVGIRRARGRFVLATSLDVIFSTELIAHLAPQPLEPGRLYRVDRRDCDPEVPRDASLETKLAYCAMHQRRVHARWGSYPVDQGGSIVGFDDDIVDGRALRLGDGWHVRERDGRTPFFRWAGDRAEVIVETNATDAAVRTLEIEAEANPRDPRAWVNLEVFEGERAISRAHVTGRMQVDVPLARTDRDGPRRLELRVKEAYARRRFHMPLFERRELSYRVYTMRVRSGLSDGSMVEYPVSGWMNANPHSTQTVTPSAEGPVVTTDSPMWSYSMHYGMLQAPASGTYRFDVSCSMLERQVGVGVLNGARNAWIPASIVVKHEANETRFSISVDLRRNETFWLMCYNLRHDGPSRFIIRGMKGSIDPARLASTQVAGLQSNSLVGRVVGGVEKMGARVQRFFAGVFSAPRWREGVVAFADSSARTVAAMLPGRTRIVRAAPEYRSIQRALNLSGEQVRALAPLQDLSALGLALRRNRPENLHVNCCGDFQLMAREDWHSLRGYPELEASSQNVDSLLAFIADAAGIQEVVLAFPIYRPQHDVQSSPDEQATLKWRLTERGVPTLDTATVSMWASQMRWLKRPIMFNGADWGIASTDLPEHTIVSAVASTS